jgi:hypothetical protein
MQVGGHCGYDGHEHETLKDNPETGQQCVSIQIGLVPV